MIRVILYRFRRTSFNSTRQNGILKTILHYEWYIQLLSLTKDIGTCKKDDHIPRYSGTKNCLLYNEVMLAYKVEGS